MGERTMRKAFVVIVLLALSACGDVGSSEKVQSSSADASIKVEVVTRFNGITLYRISSDYRSDVYVADRGSEGIQRTQYNVKSGRMTRIDGVAAVSSEAK